MNYKNKLGVLACLLGLMTVLPAHAQLGPMGISGDGLTFPDGSVQTTAAASPATYAIGDTGPAGGIVFYLEPDSGGTHGREAAPADQSAGIEWGCNGDSIAGADGTTVGTGKQNTIDIYNGCSTRPIAASVAVDYRGPTLDTLGWFLPSKDELNLMYENLHNQTVPLGGFVSGSYWSSSEVGVTTAWFEDFLDGYQAGDYKYNANRRVRAVRAF